MSEIVKSSWRVEVVDGKTFKWAAKDVTIEGEKEILKKLFETVTQLAPDSISMIIVRRR